MRSNTYHHENLKQELIENGVRLVAESGADALSMRKLAGLCGVSATAVYKHFQNKDELMQAMALYIETSFVNDLKEGLDRLQEANPWMRIIELGKEYVGFMTNHPLYFRFWLFFQSKPLIPSVHIGQSPVPGCASLQLFLKTAEEYLEDRHVPRERWEDSIISMWAMVHGLSAMLINGNIVAEGDTIEMVERILSNHLYFPAEKYKVAGQMDS